MLVGDPGIVFLSYYRCILLNDSIIRQSTATIQTSWILLFYFQSILKMHLSIHFCCVHLLTHVFFFLIVLNAFAVAKVRYPFEIRKFSTYRTSIIRNNLRYIIYIDILCYMVQIRNFEISEWSYCSRWVRN